MIIHKAGNSIIILFVILYIMLFIIVTEMTFCNILCKYILGIVGILLLCFLFFFFRNPVRKIIPDDNVVFSPADGKIVLIEKVLETEYLNIECLKISIFMSMLNIHVNRYPIGGKILYTKYHHGKYFIASLPKASELNEHHTTVIEKYNGTVIMIKQIAGTIARRVVCYAKKDEQVNQGDDIGFIKFGSRVDVFLPLNAEILVTLNEKVKGNKTTIARLNKSDF